MSGGVAFQLEISGLDAALSKIAATGSIKFDELLFALSRMGKEQTYDRIRFEKTAPDGKSWPKTVDGRSPLFITGDHLANHIDHAVVGDAAIWGVGVGGKTAGARIHQFGGVITPKNGKVLHFQIGGKDVFAKKVTMPARPYLGISSKNAFELEELALRRLAKMGGLQ